MSQHHQVEHGQTYHELVHELQQQICLQQFLHLQKQLYKLDFVLQIYFLHQVKIDLHQKQFQVSK